MAVSDATLISWRALVRVLPEFTAYQAARLTFGAATGDTRRSMWVSLFSDAQPGMSLAYRLRRAIRDVVVANATSDHSALDREGAYRSLAAEVVNEEERPLTDAEEQSTLAPAIISQLLE